MSFLFDGRNLTQQQKDAIAITDDELAEFRFFDPPDAAQRLRSDIAHRLTRATQAKQTRETSYTETESNEPE